LNGKRLKHPKLFVKILIQIWWSNGIIY